MAKRACTGTNKRGEPCKAAAMKDAEHCSAHNTLLPAETRFGSPEQARGAATAARCGGRDSRSGLMAPLNDLEQQMVRAYVLVHARKIGACIREHEKRDTTAARRRRLLGEALAEARGVVAALERLA